MEQRKQRQLNDGRLYFQYNVGAVYEFAAGFSYKILAAELVDGVEYYQIESDGAPLPVKFTLQQLDMTLLQLRNELVEEGAPEELPLLDDEITAYFAKKKQYINKRNSQATETLKNEGYYKNLSALQKLTDDILIAVTMNDARLADLQRQHAELAEKNAKILKDKNIDEKILRKIADCELCKDTGFVCGAACECTKLIADKIKTFNAERRKLRG